MRAPKPNGLRAFLNDYERQFPDEVIYVDEPVKRRHEITALVSKLEREQRFPVVVFNRVILEDGSEADMPVVSNLMGSRLRLARLMDATVERAGVAMYERMQNRLDPVSISPADAPVREIVQMGDEIDVTRIPAPVYHAMDPGPYITSGFLTTYHPETGIVNSAMHRGWLRGPRDIGVYMVPSTDNARIFAAYEAMGQDMPAAFWIGHHPLAELGCQVRVASTESHFATAGGVLGEALRVVPSATLGDDFLVPADAEIVIEGYIRAGKRAAEGPFGEYTRYDGPQRWNPCMEVTAVTRRRDAMWDELACGHTHWAGSLGKEGATYHHVKRAVNVLENVHLPMSGGGAQHVYLQLRNNRVKGMSKTALLAALSGDFSIKHAFVFDEDVDIFNDRDVMLALATRFQGDKDLIVVPGINGPTLDPSGPDLGSCKVGFDCTKPVEDLNFPPRSLVPADVLASTDLYKWIPQEILGRVPVEPWG